MISWEYPLLSSLSGEGSSVPEGGEETDFSGADPPQLRYASFAKDPATGKLAWPLRVVRGPEVVAQRVRNRFRWFLGEWFRDTRQGVPYREHILKKGADPIFISALFRQVLLKTPGVSKVVKFTSRLERATRTLVATFEAILEDGSILRAIDEPFILDF